MMYFIALILAKYMTYY